MRDNDAGSIPVAEDRKTKRLVGIITDRDLAISIVAEERDPAGTTVGDVMTPSPTVCRPDDDVDRAISAMERGRVRRIPVVDGERRLIGIVTQADIAVRSGQSAKTAEMVGAISKHA